MAAEGKGRRTSFGGWWRWFHREILCWTHPDSGLDLVLDGYGHWLKALARGPVLAGDSEAGSGYYQGAVRPALLGDIDAAMARGTSGLSELMSIESQLVSLYSDARIARRHWAFRERFERVATHNAALAYLTSDPPTAPAPPADDAPVGPAADGAPADPAAAR